MEIDLVRNTRSMSLDPQNPDKYVEMDKPRAGRSGVRCMPIMSGDVFRQFVDYPVIVEQWDKKIGRHKRRWLATFTQAERNKISRYRGRFYRWYLISGTPKRIAINLDTLNLLQRAVIFFAEC